MNLDYYATLKEVRTLVNQAGLNLVFEPQAMPRTDGSTMYVQQPDTRWGEREFTIWKGTVYHEAGHNEPAMKDVFDVLKEQQIPMGSIFGTGLNILDDYRQEKYKLGMYVGRDKMLSKSNRYLVENILEKKPANTSTSTDLDDSEISDVIQGWSVYARQDWQRDVIGLDIKWSETFSREQYSKYQVLCRDYTDKLNEALTAQQEWDLLMEILTDVFKRNAEDELEQAQQEQQQAEGNEGGEGNEQDGQAGTGDGKNPTKGRRGEKGDKGETVRAGGRVKYEDILTHDHAENDEGTSYAPLTIDYSGYDGDAGFQISENPNIRNHEKEDHGTHEYYRRDVAELHVGNGLANKVRKLLQVMTQAVNIHGQKKGRVSGKSVYRAALKNTGSAQQKIFKRKEVKYDLDVCVSVMIDCSGSMGDEKYTHAVKSGMMLNEAVSKIGVPVEILGFTERSRAPLHHIFKSFHRSVSQDKLMDRMCAGANNMGSNADGEAILWAYQRLTRQTAKRKLLIVLSDGQPASGRGDADALTKKVVKGIEKRKDVEIYGIGIQSDAVKRYYYHNAVINHPEQLEQAVLTVVKNHILK